MVIVDGKFLWAAVGDDPLTMFTLDGSDLNQVRSVASVTNVRSLAVVVIPAAKAAPVSYKVGPVRGNYGAFAQQQIHLQQLVASGTNSNQPLSRQSSRNSDAEASPSKVLWCGLDKGHIVVLDLFFFNEDGVIHNAHLDGVSGIWPVGPNGRVWTCGKDKSLKVWDAGTRKNISKRVLTASITDLCFVASTGHVWTASHDTYLRIYDVDSKEVKLPRAASFQHNIITMRGSVRMVRFHSQSNSVWVCLERQLIVFNPKTFESVGSLSVSATCVEFFGVSSAVMVAHGEAVDYVDRIVILDASDVRQLRVLELGSAVEGVSVVGLRCFCNSNFGVLPHIEGKARCLSVFTVSAMDAVANWSCGIAALGPSRAQLVASGPHDDDSAEKANEGEDNRRHQSDLTTHNPGSRAKLLILFSPCPLRKGPTRTAKPQPPQQQHLQINGSSSMRRARRLKRTPHEWMETTTLTITRRR